MNNDLDFRGGDESWGPACSGQFPAAVDLRSDDPDSSTTRGPGDSGSKRSEWSDVHRDGSDGTSPERLETSFVPARECELTKNRCHSGGRACCPNARPLLKCNRRGH